MKKFIALIIFLAPLVVIAQNKDISKTISVALTTIVSDSINDISHYSLVKNYRRANIVYTTKDSINVVSLIQSTKGIKHQTFPIIVADSIEKSLKAVRLPTRRISEILISTDSGKLTFAISSGEGKLWSKFTSYDYIVTSPIIYIHQNRLQSNNQLIAYFIGSGNLTVSDSTGKSMLFMISSIDGGHTWSEPKIALKHNLYSLNNASIGFYSRKNNKKQELFMVCSSSDTKSLFLSTSDNNGITWSYPMELPDLSNTSNHILSINKNNIALLFTDSNKENSDDNGDIYMIMTSTNDIKNTKTKITKYKIHDYTTKEEIEMVGHHKLNHTIGGMLYRPHRLMFTISTPLTPKSPSSVKVAIINVSKRNIKIL